MNDIVIKTLARIIIMESKELFKKIGKLIKIGLVKKNIKTTDFAKRLGVSQSQVSHWTAGRTTIQIDTLLRVVDLLDIGDDFVALFFPGCKNKSTDDAREAVKIIGVLSKEIAELRRENQVLRKLIEKEK